MSGIACAVDTGDVVQLVTGHKVENSYDEYETDPLFNQTAKVIAQERGSSLAFLFAATEHVYEINAELVRGPEI